MLEKLLEELKMHGALSLMKKIDVSKKDHFIELLEAELLFRKDKALKRRLSQAKFPVTKEWVELDQSLNPDIDFNRVKRHFNAEFVGKKQNLCLIGNQGTGKTHCLIALGRELCRKGKTVRFYTACELVNILEEAKKEIIITKVMKAILKPQLIIIDELGFVPFSENGARLLFDVFASRYERGSIAVSTNLSFDKWMQVFGSIELTAALIDRFSHKADIIPFEGDSIRLLHAKKRKKV
jgi:DNA replication protein DnaC